MSNTTNITFTKIHNVSDKVMECCEHVTKDLSLVCEVMVTKTEESEQLKALCKECTLEMLKKLDKEEEEADTRTEVCYDCHKEVRRAKITYWRWYDFCAAQGDEPIKICDNCLGKTKHVNRVLRDREDYEEEMRRYK